MILDRLREKREISVNDWGTTYSSDNGYDTSFEGIKEATYFSCISIISESIARCNLELKQDTESGEVTNYKHYLYDILRLRCNPYMTAIDAYRTYVALAKHYGIAGLYIDRQANGKVKGLYPVKITKITIDDKGILKSNAKNKVLYSFTVAGSTQEHDCLDADIVLLKDFTLDGISTKATKTIIKENLDTSIKSQNYLNKLFSNGLTNKIVVQLSSDLKDEAELKKVQEKFGRIYSNNGKIFTVPAGYNINSLNLSLADAQYEQLRRLSKEEIAMSFHVPLSKLGWIGENAKSEEQDNLQFLQDCLQVIFQNIEQEMSWKLLTTSERQAGYKIRFNIGTLLRTDQKTQADIISTYVKNGVYDLDYARGLLGVPLIGGEKIITLPSGQVLLKDLLAGNVSYQNKKAGE